MSLTTDKIMDYEASEKSRKINAISEILQKYCEPRPEISGVLARDVARKILTAIEKMDGGERSKDI